MIYDPPISAAIALAAARLQDAVAGNLPHSADAIADWMRRLAGSQDPADYFRHPHAFPMLLLPWWVEQALTDEADADLQGALAFSTMAGYYHIRLIDNLMDGHATNEQQLLPALGVFHTHFMAPYMDYFAAGHPFWDDFRATWFHAADCTIHDGQAAEIDLAHFQQFSGQKVGAGLIPIAAVCHRHGRPDLLPAWRELVGLLGCWHQLFNDLFSWSKDLATGTRTWFLCEAERRKLGAEPVAAWVMREGFAWAVALLDEWLASLRAQAARVGSAPLGAYLETRGALLAEQAAGVEAGFRAVGSLLALARPAEA